MGIQMLSYKEFQSAVQKRHVPSMYEVHGDRRLHQKFRAHPVTGTILYYQVYKLIHSYVNQGTVLLDLGAYPGTFLRLCKHVLFHSNNLKLFGHGLVCEEDEVRKYSQKHCRNPETKSTLTDKTFVEFMKSEGIEFLHGNLDYCSSHKTETSTENSLEEVYGQCDIVTCIEVIEHLHTPYHLFNLFNRLLKKGGICIVETNNIRWLARLAMMLIKDTNLDMELVEKYKLNDLTIKHPHTRFYSISEIETLFQKAGFKVLVKYDYNWYYPIPLFLRNADKLKGIAKKLISTIPGFRSHIIIMAEKL